MVRKDRPTAVGSHVFAGGFTLGVREHFDVAMVLEQNNYGVATMRLNQPEVPVVVGYGAWPIDDLRKHEWDFVFGNPPCAVWSQAGAATKKGRTWDSSPLVACTERHFELLGALRPHVWAWESVQRAWTVGESFVRGLALRARDLGYSTTIFLHDAQYLGVPQRRQRFFMIAHDVELDIEEPEWSVTTIDDALRAINDPGEPLERNIGKVRHLISRARQGENLSSTFMRLTPPDEVVTGARGQVVGRPPFTIKRARSGVPAPVVMHELVHPTEDRGLSIKELAVLCGYPPLYEFVGATDAGQVGRGVCPPVAEYLARQVARAVREGRPAGEPVLRLVDFTTPQTSERVLDWGQPTEDRVAPESEEVSNPALGAGTWVFGGQPTTRSPTVDSSPRPAAARSPAADSSLGPGSGAYIRSLLVEGRSTEEILEAVRRRFPASRAGPGDVSWNRNRLRREGVAVADRQGRQGSRADQLPPAAAPPAAAAEPEASPDAPQPQARRDGVDPDRDFDRSSLRANAHGRWVHRDYAAHFFRWGFAGRFVTGDTDVLDVGCGVDCAMIDVLTHPRSNVPRRYVGVDLNRAPQRVPRRGWAEILWEFDVTRRGGELGQFDVVTCLEVLEHMRRADGLRLIAALRDRLRDADSRLLLSTPVFNGKAAANHLHEWTVEELGAALAEAGLDVVRRHGTFASEREVLAVATEAERDLAVRLKKYYSGEVVACFLAPLHPDASRNCVWVARRRD